MLRDDQILQTRLVPPRRHRRLLARPGLTARLTDALEYRLTLLQAGTGYGKSTALAELAETAAFPVFWYSVAEPDTDPQRFLAYLIAAFQHRLPALSALPQVMLQEAHARTPGDPWRPVVEALVNALAPLLTAPALLVVDDFHFVSHSPPIAALAEHFAANLPPHLHVLLATRHPLRSPLLTAWRVRGELLELQRDALVFQPTEIDALFRETYGMRLTPEEVGALSHKTEGWPIALQLVWQGMRGRAAASLPHWLAGGPAPGAPGAEPLSDLFDYLAHEVMDRQPPEIAAFLRDTALLRELTPGACVAITGSPEAATWLTQSQESDLFIVTLSEGQARYHHLFHEFLRGQWAGDLAGARERHRRAAAHFHAEGRLEEALYHSLGAERWEDAAQALEAVGEAQLRAGHLETVAHWLDALPPAVLATHPLLLRFLGDINRLRSRFDDALAWYQQAERLWRAHGDAVGVGRALRGQALVYLDTVRPAQAESLLEEALRLSDGLPDTQAQARMLELLAENKLNLGKPHEAEQLRLQARALLDGPDEDALSVRVKLRTGRLDEAQAILEAWAQAERGHTHAPRAHRETPLLLSLIYAFRGEAEAARTAAAEGLRLGEQLNSPFVAAVAHIRLGHAAQLGAAPGAAFEAALDHFKTSISIGDQLAVRRVRAEAMWGLCRAYGFASPGDPAQAERAAHEGIEICQWAGDQWLTALTELTLAATYVLAGRPEAAVPLLGTVVAAFRECGDPFGRAAARLWLCLAHLQLREPERFASNAEELLALCDAQHYDFLFTRPSLLGPPDPRQVVPILVGARQRRLQPAYANRLLTALGLPEVALHPGYQLRVQALGQFRAWRGAQEIQPREWKRDKARQLFQLLLAQRGRPLQREAITEKLWPTLGQEAAGRDFKVALNALYKTLEPDRPAEAPSAYIAREGAAYSLRPEADLWVDAIAFERAVTAALAALDGPEPLAALDDLHVALQRYTGDFLVEAVYEDWASDERERLLALFLRAADRLAGGLIAHRRFEAGLAVCQRILERDGCWERAYRLMMAAHSELGNRPQALRAFQACREALQRELEVDPAPATTALYARIVQGAPIPLEEV